MFARKLTASASNAEVNNTGKDNAEEVALGRCYSLSEELVAARCGVVWKLD